MLVLGGAVKGKRGKKPTIGLALQAAVKHFLKDGDFEKPEPYITATPWDQGLRQDALDDLRDLSI